MYDNIVYIFPIQASLGELSPLAFCTAHIHHRCTNYSLCTGSHAWHSHTDLFTPHIHYDLLLWNVPWWTSCAFFPPSVFCLVTPIAPPFILTSLDEWGSVFVCWNSLCGHWWGLRSCGLLDMYFFSSTACLTHLIVQHIFSSQGNLFGKIS